ncbi:hypothetical protein [Paraburkholderia sediminicola]|uniref:hypothetical protein n=1 Tax=Paraburkholderia sediminicola TaxID=458836 RepID=UPI0038BAE8B7
MDFILCLAKKVKRLCTAGCKSPAPWLSHCDDPCAKKTAPPQNQRLLPPDGRYIYRNTLGRGCRFCVKNSLRMPVRHAASLPTIGMVWGLQKNAQSMYALAEACLKSTCAFDGRTGLCPAAFVPAIRSVAEEDDQTISHQFWATGPGDSVTDLF